MTVWTARIVVALYFASLVAAGWSPQRTRSPLFARLWGLAALALAVHVVAAFEWTHHWSWQHAVEHTTRETERVVGRASGIELWANFVFLGWWLADSGYRLTKVGRSLPQWYQRTVQLVWGFMFFNATVVFGPPLWRWLVPVLSLGMVLIALKSRASDSAS